MIGVVIASHGDLARSLATTAGAVTRSNIRIEAVSIDPIDDTAAYGARLTQAVDAVETGEGVLVLTDMFGGTPSNVGMTLHRSGKVEVLTGVNLPMVIKALQISTSGANLTAAAVEVKEAGMRAITIATEVLAPPAQTTAP